MLYNKDRALNLLATIQVVIELIAFIFRGLSSKLRKLQHHVHFLICLSFISFLYLISFIKLQLFRLKIIQIMQ